LGQSTPLQDPPTFGLQAATIFEPAAMLLLLVTKPGLTDGATPAVDNVDLSV
jgi:hypothetical protein